MTKRTTRSGGAWSQKGVKLVSTEALGNAQQGISVSLASDGNTALVGGPGDNMSVGAAFVFTRSGGVWSAKAKLIGTGVIGYNPRQGNAVAISPDGNTAILGAPLDNAGAGLRINKEDVSVAVDAEAPLSVDGLTGLSR